MKTRHFECCYVGSIPASSLERFIVILLEGFLLESLWRGTQTGKAAKLKPS